MSGHALGMLVLVAVAVGCQDPRSAPAGQAEPRSAPAGQASGSGGGPPASRDEGRDIGTAHPILVVRAARSGRWIIACQARSDTDGVPGHRVVLDQHGAPEGDAMTGYLFRGPGTGQPIEGVMSISDDDRWLAVVKAGKLVLLDEVWGTETILGSADPRRPDPIEHAAFDGLSRRLVYARARAEGSVLTVRDLSSRREREISLPSRRVLSVFPEKQSSWVRLVYVSAGPEPAGARAAEGTALSAAALPASFCRGRPFSISFFGGSGPPTRSAWLSLETGQLREDPSVIAHLGDREVIQGTDRALRIGDEEIAPAACDASVSWVMASPPRVVGICTSAGDRGPLELFGPGLHTVFPEIPWFARKGRPVWTDRRYLCFPGRSLVCIAAQDGRRVWLGGRAVAMYGTQILRWDAQGRYSVVDGETGATTPLLAIHGEWSLAAGRFVAIENTVIDLASASVVGELARTPIALDRAGRGLVALGGNDREVPLGPLRWTVPRAPGFEPIGSGTSDDGWVVQGEAVDEAGRPVAHAVIAVTDAASVGQADASDPSTVLHGARRPYGESPLQILPERTDASGRFWWQADPFHTEGHAVLITADDGRVGMVGAVSAATSSLRVELRPPGALHVTCKGFGRTDGEVSLASGALTTSLPCGATVRGIPPGHYELVFDLGSDRYARSEVDVPSGAVADVALEIPPVRELELRIVEYPSNQPLRSVSCWAGVSFSGDMFSSLHVDNAADGSLRIKGSQGPYVIRCEGEYEQAADGEAQVELGAAATATVRLVRFRRDGSDVGAEIEAEPAGARVVRTRRRAARAGLLRGDLVVAVDDVPLAGLSQKSMAALAFRFAPEATIRWTVERGGRRLRIEVPPW